MLLAAHHRLGVARWEAHNHRLQTKRLHLVVPARLRGKTSNLVVREQGMCLESMRRSLSDSDLVRTGSQCSLSPSMKVSPSNTLRRTASFNVFNAKVLGAGSTSVVFQCTDVESAETFAVKSPRSPRAREECLSPRGRRDSRVLEQLRHENVVEHHQSCDDGSMIMEYLDGGSLLSVMDRAGGSLNEVQTSALTRQILKGVAYLHSKGVVHKDIKPANILFDSRTNTAKLSDIEFASEAASSRSCSGVLVPVGTPSFLAPEVVRTGSHVQESDIWAVGCTVLQLVTGRIPWAEEDNSFSALFKIGNGHHPELPNDKSDELTSFLQICFQPVDARPSAAALLEHPFVVLAPAGPLSP